MRTRQLIPLGIFLLAVVARLVPGPRTIDDAFITFRYSRNLLQGQGLVFNPGEHVLGTTTPLYAILMAGVAAVTGGPSVSFPERALIVNALSDGLSCLLLLAIGTSLGFRFAGIGAALVWAVAPFSVTFAIGGLETSFVVLLLCSLYYFYLKQHYSATALLAGLALLTRPDALILIAPLGLDRLISSLRHRTSPIRWPELIAFAGPILSWSILATIYYGMPISQSILAKSMAYRLPGTAALVRLIQHYSTPFLEQLTFGNWWIAVGLVLFPFLCLLGILKVLRINRRAWPFLLYPWFYLLAFAIADPLIFRWYLTPPLPFYILTILIGMESLIQNLFGRIKNPNRLISQDRSNGVRWAALGLFTILIPVGLSLRGWILAPDHGSVRPAPEMAWYQLEINYQQAAEFLEPYIKSGDILAASDVGVLGYFTRARILDTVGLNSPVALQYYPIDPNFYVINLATSPDLIMATNPDFVVLLEVYGREGVFKDERFKQEYKLLKKIPTDIYGSDGMLIFGRRAPS